MDPLRISIVGLSKWESVFVQTTVDLASGMEIAPWKFVDDPKGADVLLVDADRHSYESPQGDKESQQPIVVSFCEDTSSASAVSGRGLMRPVGYKDLIAVLKDIENELQAAADPPPPAVAEPPAEELPVLRDAVDRESIPIIWEQLFDATDRSGEVLPDKARPARRFVEGTRFLGLLKRILQWRAPAEVSHLRFPAVRVFPEQHAFVSSGDPTSIPRMFRDSALSFKTRELTDEEATASLSLDTHRPLSHLIYCAALFGSEGRLLLHTNPEDRLQLADWPDFNSVPHLPEHRDIAKFMLVHAASLADIATSTGVSIRVVVDFCNACEAVGLVRRIPNGHPKRPGGIDARRTSPIPDSIRDLFKES